MVDRRRFESVLSMLKDDSPVVFVDLDFSFSNSSNLHSLQPSTSLIVDASRE